MFIHLMTYIAEHIFVYLQNPHINVFILHKLQGRNIDFSLLRSAMVATSQKRNSFNIVGNYESIIDGALNNDTMNKNWKGYQKDFSYAKDISFKETCEVIKEIMNDIWI